MMGLVPNLSGQLRDEKKESLQLSRGQGDYLNGYTHVKWISNWAPLVDDGICLELVGHWAKLGMTKIPVSAMNKIRHRHKAVTLMDIRTKNKPILTRYLMDMDMDVDLMVPVPVGIGTF
jgi:hypothetical protein